MNIELENKLVKRFPLLFRGRYKSIRENLMAFGCEHGNGWYNILYTMCLGIEEEINREYSWSYRKLYYFLIAFEEKFNRLMWKLPKVLQRKTKFGHIPYFLVRFPKITMFTQIKEKYGTLNVYVNHASDTVYNYIQIAETCSAYICEQCGKWGKFRGNGWYYTACDEHTRPEDKETLNNE